MFYFGSWSTIPSSEESKKEVEKPCEKCSGTGIIVTESWKGDWTYMKCKDCEGKGKKNETQP